MPFINKELQQFCLHLNINNNTLQTLGYQDFHYFDGESGYHDVGMTSHFCMGRFGIPIFKLQKLGTI